VKPVTIDVGTATFIRLLGLTKIISSDLEWFNLRLLLHAQPVKVNARGVKIKFFQKPS